MYLSEVIIGVKGERERKEEKEEGRQEGRKGGREGGRKRLHGAQLCARGSPQQSPQHWAKGSKWASDEFSTYPARDHRVTSPRQRPRHVV